MISDSQLMDLWADATRRAGKQQHISYPSVAVLRAFYEMAYDHGDHDGTECERLSV